MPRPVNPTRPGLRNYLRRQFHAYFQNAFSGITTQGLQLLEVGCAASVWLPYFAKTYGFQVTGLDYSEIGCELERHILVDENVQGEVVCADLFSPPGTMLGAFDVIVSFGLIEHFEDTPACIEALSRYLKTGGIMITNIPNLAGTAGTVQKILNRPIFDIHVVLDARDLRLAHEKAGLEVLQHGYFLSTAYSVCNLEGLKEGSLGWMFKKFILLSLVGLSVLVWSIESKIGPFKVSKLFSPYINCIARKNP